MYERIYESRKNLILPILHKNYSFLTDTIGDPKLFMNEDKRNILGRELVLDEFMQKGIIFENDMFRQIKTY